MNIKGFISLFTSSYLLSLTRVLCLIAQCGLQELQYKGLVQLGTGRRILTPVQQFLPSFLVEQPIKLILYIYAPTIPCKMYACISRYYTQNIYDILSAIPLDYLSVYKYHVQNLLYINQVLISLQLACSGYSHQTILQEIPFIAIHKIYLDLILEQ